MNWKGLIKHTVSFWDDENILELDSDNDSHHFMGNRWGNSGNSVRLYFGCIQILVLLVIKTFFFLKGNRSLVTSKRN